MYVLQYAFVTEKRDFCVVVHSVKPELRGATFKCTTQLQYRDSLVPCGIAGSVCARERVSVRECCVCVSVRARVRVRVCVLYLRAFVWQCAGASACACLLEYIRSRVCMCVCVCA